MTETWETRLHKQLFGMRDTAYRDFHARLVPTLDKETVIGVRTPALRAFAKEYGKSDDRELFLRALPHRYYEENNLHMMLISGITDFSACLAAVGAFLPYVDNWATCDLPVPQVFTKHKEELLPTVRRWLLSGKTYTVRYGIDVLMALYLDADFRPEYLSLAAASSSGEYYVDMAVAWYFATALAKQWDATLPFLAEHRLTSDVHKKTVRKAVESYRISPEKKILLRSL